MNKYKYEEITKKEDEQIEEEFIADIVFQDKSQSKIVDQEPEE